MTQFEHYLQRFTTTRCTQPSNQYYNFSTSYAPSLLKVRNDIFRQVNLWPLCYTVLPSMLLNYSLITWYSGGRRYMLYMLSI